MCACTNEQPLLLVVLPLLAMPLLLPPRRSPRRRRLTPLREAWICSAVEEEAETTKCVFIL
jgi:hypothetical protein